MTREDVVRVLPDGSVEEVPAVPAEGKYFCTKCERNHKESSKIGTAHESHRRREESVPRRDLIDAEMVEIDASGAIVPLGTRGRRGVRPPPHTFYEKVVIHDPLGSY